MSTVATHTRPRRTVSITRVVLISIAACLAVTWVVLVSGAAGSDGAAGARIVAYFLVGGGMYLLPTIIAGARGSRYQNAVAIINILTGLTGIGWVVALALAVWPDPRHATAPGPSMAAPTAPAGVYMVGGQARQWDGTRWVS